MVRKGLRRVVLVLALLLVAFLPGGLSLAQAPAGLTLPPGAIKLSDAVPAMGEHWARPQQLPLGPIYMVWQGKVIGVEYMFDPPMMKRVAIPTPAGEVVYYALENLALGGVKFDHMTVDYIWPGHPGFEKGHYDIHLYTITPEERYKIVVPGTPPAPVTTRAGESLPAQAIKVSGVVPAMGEHWIIPGGWKWGPTYLMYKGKLIGVEYEFNHDPLKCAKEVHNGGEVWVCDIGLIPVGTTLNHLNIEYLPKGHEGMEFWHYAIHMYAITPEERGKVVP